MPRKSRYSLPGNFFHIMVQGINRESIFKEDKYKEKYIKILSEQIKKFNVKIISYCVMGNHAHMLFYVNDIQEMIKFMQKVNTIYAIFYNKTNNRVGFVFRDRYKTQSIKNQKHLFACIAYIHKNPLKAGMVNKIDEYQYSSYNQFINYKKDNLISNEIIKSIFEIKDIKKFEDLFYAIHKLDFDEEFIDEKQEENYKEIINYYKNKKFSIENIVKILNEKYKLSDRAISKMLEISRYKANTILKNNK